MKKPIVKSITINGRRWFDKANGNTYHGSTVYVNGKKVFDVPFQYGYEDHYVQSAQEKLEKLGYIDSKIKNRYGKALMSLWNYCNEKNIILEYSAVDVKRKKDV